MSSATLVAAALVDASVAALLFYVGWVVARREASAGGRRALRAFRVWWVGLGVTVAANALREGIAAAGLDQAPALVAALNAFQYVYFAALCAAVWGLLYYLVYLYTGHERWYGPLATFYLVYASLAMWTVFRMRPAGVTPGKWFVQWSYEDPAIGGALVVVLTLLLLLPQIVAAIAYLRVAKRTDLPLARFRVRLVAWSLILWLGISLLAPFLQLGRFEWWQAGGRLVGLAAAIAILLAYRTPEWILRRLRQQEARS